ncbi:MAG: carboxypeptidase-like regulatory domain-containing protein [Bryobacteraceae bacterium]
MTNRHSGQLIGFPGLSPFAKITSITLFLLLAPFGAHAQSFLASVSGIVSDQSGAVAPNVKVTVTDIARGVRFTTTTNQDGVYVINDLIPSTYKVTAEAAGFQTYQLSEFPLQAKQEAGLNISLQLGTSTQTVEVSSQVQMVDPSNATLGGVVNNKSIVDLPIINRNILTLMALEPGVQPSTQNNYSSNFFTSAIRYSFNGGLESTSDFQQDGISILNQSDIPGIMGLTMLPSVDAVDEMRVQTNSYSASYGRSGGGITTMVTKSGTNAFHGTAFDFLRNNALNANNFFSNRSGAKIAPLHENQFGGSIGGPIIKNKTFFFGVFERDINNAGGFNLFTVPTAAERAGDFSGALNAAGQLKTIYNPFSTTSDPNNAGQYLRMPFPGNVIPASLLDPVGVKAASYWPTPNLFGLTNNLAKTAVSANPLEQITTKVDHNFSVNKRAFIRYGYLYNVAGSPNYFNNLADEGYGPMTVRAHNAALGYTQTLGDATVLELRAGINRFSALRPSNGLGFQLTNLGLPTSVQNYLLQGDVPEFPGIAVQGYSTLGNNNGPYYESHELDYIFSGTLMRVIGKHTLTIGAEQRDYFLNFFQTNPMVMNFGADMSQGPNPRTVAANSGDAVASMLLGTGDSGSAGYYARAANGNHYFAEFAQDDIKWTRKLTMNVGFRLEEETATTERYNRMAAIDPSVLNPISNQVTNPFTGQTPWNLYGGYVFAGNGPDSLGNHAIRGIEIKPSPRIGIAYSLNDKTVIRTGYGIFFGVPYDGATREFTSGAFATSTPWVATVDGIHPNTLMSDPFPAGYFYPPGRSQGLLSAVGQNLVSANPSTLKTLYNQQWNFSIQRSLATNTLLQVAYVGNKGTHLAWSGGGGTASMNQLAPQYSALGNQLLTLVNNPFYGIITTGPLAQPQVQYGQLLRPFPAWQTVGSDGIAIGNSEYEALQTSFTKRYTNGVSLIAGYTWSKLMTDISDGIWSTAGSIRSYYCVRCEHSNGAYDVPHRFTLSAVGELPFGKGKMFGSSWNRVTDTILGGWQANGILTLASGVPLVFGTAANTSYTFGGGQHPDVIGNPVLSSGKSIYQWFNTTAFAQPANFTSGDLSRTYAGDRADWTRNLDFSLFKNFSLTERFKLQFRAEAFNLTNTPVFGAPGTSINGANFGVITGQSNPPRNLQLALKVLF